MAASLQKPAVLLVHGFGAFGEQWRGQIKGLSEAGYQVLATSSHLIVSAWAFR